MSKAEKITDHKQIEAWARARGGKSARVAETAGKGDEASRSKSVAH